MIFRRREQLLDCCINLILKNGFQVTGLSAIVEASGIQKATIYTHYPSKEHLLADALKRHGELWREWFFSEVEHRSRRASDRLPAVFSVLEDWLSSPEFRGCLFHHAMAEFPRKSNRVHKAARQHKQAIHERLTLLAKNHPQKKRKSPQFADEVILLFEGAIATAHLSGSAKPAKLVQKILAS